MRDGSRTTRRGRSPSEGGDPGTRLAWGTRRGSPDRVRSPTDGFAACSAARQPSSIGEVHWPWAAYAPLNHADLACAKINRSSSPSSASTGGALRGLTSGSTSRSGGADRWSGPLAASAGTGGSGANAGPTRGSGGGSGGRRSSASHGGVALPGRGGPVRVVPVVAGSGADRGRPAGAGEEGTGGGAASSAGALVGQASRLPGGGPSGAGLGVGTRTAASPGASPAAAGAAEVIGTMPGGGGGAETGRPSAAAYRSDRAGPDRGERSVDSGCCGSDPAAQPPAPAAAMAGEDQLSAPAAATAAAAAAQPPAGAGEAGAGSGRGAAGAATAAGARPGASPGRAGRVAGAESAVRRCARASTSARRATSQHPTAATAWRTARAPAAATSGPSPLRGDSAMATRRAVRASAIRPRSAAPPTSLAA